MARPALNTDRLFCQAQQVIDQGSKSFAAATRLFSAEMRRDVVFLYTWCRHCDDLTDGQQLGQGRIQTATRECLDELRAHSLAALNGQPAAELPYQALAAVAQRHPINDTMVGDHIRGFELDVAGWQPKTFEDTLQYCYHTAGTVGIMMATIMDVRKASILSRASDLGIAFQLTNIARDVVEDATAGRSYLPHDWLNQSGLEIAELADKACHPRVFPLVQRLLNEAEPYYRSARIGARALPRRAGWAIGTAQAVYRDIGRQLLRRGPDALSQRSVTGKGRKAWRVITSAPGALAPRRSATACERVGLWTPPQFA